MCALRLSPGLANEIASGFGVRDALSSAVLRIYSGAQPATADLAPVGTLLGTFTLSGAALTGPVKATATIQLTGGAGGSIDTVTVGGSIPLIGAAVAFNGTLAQTAADLATAINTYSNGMNITASVLTDTVTLSAPFWIGAGANGLTLATTKTTITTTDDATFASGVNAANGLNWNHPAVSGVLSKESTSWQMTAVATGTAQSFRFEANPGDTQGVSTSFVRLDGSIATTGADLNLSSTSIVSGGVYTINSWTLTVPKV